MRLSRPVAVLWGLACAGGETLPSDADLARLTFVEDLRIGSVDDPIYALTFVTELAVSRDGRIYSAHAQEALIRVFAADGEFLRTIGRRGEGPGEFNSLGAMGLLGDTLWALDHALSRFSYFSLDGELRRTRNNHRAASRSPTERPPRPRGLLSDGGVLGAPPAYASLVMDATIQHQVLLRIDDAGRILDTLVVQPVTNTLLEITDPDDPGGFASYRPQPFTDTDLAQISPFEPAVVWISRPAAVRDGPQAFRVTKLALTGDTAFSAEIRYQPRRLDETLVDSLARTYAEDLANSPVPGAPTVARAVELARAAMLQPAFHPPVSAFVFGRDSTLWLRREMAGEIVEWLVLSADGRAIGIVPLSARFDLKTAQRDRVWGWVTDDLDVPYIVRMSRAGDG